MSAQTQYSIQSTAGAVPVRNEKGEVSMQKVKVHRYISGKRPEYAQYRSSDEESEDDDFIDRRAQRSFANRGDDSYDTSRKRDDITSKDDSYKSDEAADDPRLRRLARHRSDSEDDDDDAGEHYRESRLRRYKERRIQEPEIIVSENEDIPSEREMQSDNDEKIQYTMDIERKRRIDLDDSGSGSDSELSDTEIEKRRQRLKSKMLHHRKDEEVLERKEEEKQSESSDAASSYEEETESEEENEPRLKPLFVSKKDRATIAEKEKEAQKQKQLEYETKRLAKERRRQTLRLVEESVKKDLEKSKANETNEASIDDVCTDDENDEVEYEAWKLRELKRIKRDREEKEQMEKEKSEIERIRNLTEDERRLEARSASKEITNKATKGKYKFLQKYYHRGAFFLDQDQDIYKRDFAQATLEDHFDKTILPKVMQVKNFGRCGRTKYTHLVDQDTTQFDSPWYSDTSNNIKFHNEKAGGMKQLFEKPSLSKRSK